MTRKTPNQETRVPSPRTPCILSALLCNPGPRVCSPSTPCILTAQVTHWENLFLREKTRRHLLSSAGPSRNPVISPNQARVTTPVNSQPQTPNGVFSPRCLALTHLELDRKSPSHSWPLAPTSHEDGPRFSTHMCRVLRATQIPIYLGSTSPVSQTDAPNI